MIREPSLRKIVSTNTFAPVAAPDHELPRRGYFRALLLLLALEQASAQNFHALGSIFVLRFFILAGNHDSGRNMRNAYGGIRRVDALPARSRRAENVNSNLLRIDRNFHFVRFRQHRYSNRRGVDSA